MSGQAGECNIQGPDGALSPVSSPQGPCSATGPGKVAKEALGLGTAGVRGPGTPMGSS